MFTNTALSLVDVEFIDHTGKITGLKLFDDVVAGLINMKAKEFTSLDARAKAILQSEVNWKKCKVSFKV